MWNVQELEKGYFSLLYNHRNFAKFSVTNQAFKQDKPHQNQIGRTKRAYLLISAIKLDHCKPVVYTFLLPRKLSILQFYELFLI